MSRLLMPSPLSIANRLFLAFLFGMIVVIGCLILVKKTPLQAQAHPLDASSVVLHVAHHELSIEPSDPLTPEQESAQMAQH
jgi:hypothetical protein